MQDIQTITCPVCNQTIPLIENKTYAKCLPSLRITDETYFHNHIPSDYHESTILISFFYCANCHKYSIQAEPFGTATTFKKLWIQPQSISKHYPEYIPKAIRTDYEEAFLIVELSPRASAVLSRRCIQSIIRDHWQCKEDNLCKAIDSISDKLDKQTCDILNAIRQIGNNGAHPGKDIEDVIDISSDDAINLLKSIEFLIQEYYINPHQKEELFDEVIGLNNKFKHSKK